MKPSAIFDVLDLARKVTKQGGLFHPMFMGAPGIAKSENVKKWAKRHNLPIIDLRGAYLESTDVVGFPSVTLKDGRQITVHNIPEFWPDGRVSEEGVLFVDELNRSTTAVMNVFMQLLTDKKVHTYDFPPGWVIVSAVNPENAENDVNVMDSALKNRFVTFQIDYDRQDHIQHMKDSNYDPLIIQWVESGTWSYVPPEAVGDVPGTKYISPRTITQLNDALKAGIPDALQMTVFEAILGSNQGKAFYTFYHNESPVTYEELVKNPDLSLAKLKKYSDPNNLKYGHIEVTLKDIVEKNEITDDLLAKVLVTIPADRSYQLLKELTFKGNKDILKRMMENYPEVLKYVKANLKDTQTVQQ